MKELAISALRGAGSFIFLGLMVIGALTLLAAWLFGAAWLSVEALPWLTSASVIALLIVIFFLLPLAVFRATRVYAAIGVFLASYVFGVTLWMSGFLLTLDIWGVWAVVLGLFVAGVGVVPIAFLATLFAGEWGELGALAGLCAATFGSRGLVAYLLTLLENDEAQGLKFPGLRKSAKNQAP